MAFETNIFLSCSSETVSKYTQSDMNQISLFEVGTTF